MADVTRRGEVTRGKKRKGQQAYRAFVYLNDGEDCRFCPHDAFAHTVGADREHIYRPATEKEIGQYRARMSRAPTIFRLKGYGETLFVQKFVQKFVTPTTVFCKECATEYNTGQVVCYHRTVGAGEVLGVQKEAVAA